MITREELIERAQKHRKEIAQIFTDLSYWNDNVRPAHVNRIDPDPTGQLTKMAKAYDEMLSKEIPGYEPPK